MGRESAVEDREEGVNLGIAGGGRFRPGYPE